MYKLHVLALEYHNQALHKKCEKKVNGFHYKNKPTINHKAQLCILYEHNGMNYCKKGF